MGEVSAPLTYGWLEQLASTKTMMRGDYPSESTIRSHSVLIRRILQHAVTKGHIMENPWPTKAELPTSLAAPKHDPLDSDGIEAFSEEEVWRIADSIRPEYRPLVIACGFGGLRIEEAITLRDADFFTIAGYEAIRVHRQWSQRLGIERLPKNDKVREVAVVNQTAGAELRKWLMDRPTRDAKSAPQVRYTFTSPRGFRIRYDNFIRDWHNALDRSGISHTGTHALRRSAITAWVNSYGLTSAEAADMAGNSADVIERHYRKTQPVSDILDKLTMIQKLTMVESIQNAESVVHSDGSISVNADADVKTLPANAR